MTDYKSVGVDAGKKEGSLHRLLEHVNRTFGFNQCRPLLPIGYFANVLDLRPAGFPIGIAFSTDGVGTKLLVAELADRYDTVGIDCVAMNVNDILCVGATPISMVDYIAVSEANPTLLEQIGRGLARGCELAGINLSGGELAQVSELLAHKSGKVSFDIVGTAIGYVEPEKLIIGRDVQEGDWLIGFESSGLHSNGYTLARKICFEVGKFKIDQYIPELKRTVGEELLEPTRIYVKEILQILRKVPTKALFHITGDGFFNLTRTEKAVGYNIDFLPPAPPIFHLLQQTGKVAKEEMYRVFNMGTGYAMVIPPDSEHLKTIQKITEAAGYKAFRIGSAAADSQRTVRIQPAGLRGRGGAFETV